MPFCSNCGSEVKAGDKFCNNCGAPLQPTAPQPRQVAPPPPPPPPAQQQRQPQPTYQPPAQHGETVLGKVEGAATGFPVTIYSLLLTNTRIIAAKVGRFNASFTSGGVAGAGIVGGLIGAGLDATVNRGRKQKTEKMSQMTPDMILAQDKKNFMIPFASIQSVEMKTPGLMGIGELKIMTPGKDYKFQIQTKKEVFQPYVALFSRMLPGRVFVK